MAMELLAAGRVTATHGVAGAVKVKIFADSSAHLLALKTAVFRRGASERTLRITVVRPQPGGVIMEVEGVGSPEQARVLVGCELWVPRASALPLAPGEYYEADLCRCRLWFGSEEIGRVRSVWEGGPVQLLEIEGAGGKVHLVPFTEHFVGEVDVAAGRIELREDGIVR